MRTVEGGRFGRILHAGRGGGFRRCRSLRPLIADSADRAGDLLGARWDSPMRRIASRIGRRDFGIDSARRGRAGLCAGGCCDSTCSVCGASGGFWLRHLRRRSIASRSSSACRGACILGWSWVGFRRRDVIVEFGCRDFQGCVDLIAKPHSYSSSCNITTLPLYVQAFPLSPQAFSAASASPRLSAIEALSQHRHVHCALRIW